MITIFHGENAALSRKQYTDTKLGATNPITFDGSAISIATLTQALEGQELFATENQVFIEDFLSKRRASKEVDAIIDYLATQSSTNTITLWESKELTAKQANSFGKQAVVKKFDLPKEVFAFLDSLLPNNYAKTLLLFHKTLETEEVEFIFFMIVRQFRLLLGVISTLSEQRELKGRNPMGISPASDAVRDDIQIDELKRIAPWQKGKLQKQANAFKTDQLLQKYDQLFAIEKNMKTGQLLTTLEQTIDMFLLSL